MFESLLADLVLVVHFGFILFVLFGGLLSLALPRVAYLHVPAAAWGVWIELSGRVCPLTPLENSLRTAAGEAGYEGGFIEHYLLPLIYPNGLTRGVQFALAGVVLVLNAAVYFVVWRRAGRRRRGADDS